MSLKKLILSLLFILHSIALWALAIDSIERIDPPNWWIGMENKELHILVKGNNIGKYTTLTINKKGLTVLAIKPAQNSNFLYVDLLVDDDATEGVYEFTFKEKTNTLNFKYSLTKKQDAKPPSYYVNESDLIYLVMPDRFVNGDIKNDSILKYTENRINRNSDIGRHGGDLKGISKHLDYIEELGATALWLNPVQENNQPLESYHGYAITDHYKIDARLGNLNDYKSLVDEAHKMNIKIVMDMVFNHTGNEHYLFKNKPSKDWFHEFTNFTRTNYRATSLMDPYASEYDKNLMKNAWFDKHMPDLNQTNERLSDYLIYNSIWWIETTGINGFRVDTWANPDADFMKKWTTSVLKEYPNFTIFGEVWEHGPAIQAKFTNNIFNEEHNGSMPSCIDFELYYAINDALTKDFGWTEGVSRIYYTLAQDFLYKNPQKNVIFLDNHDLSRFTSMIDGNMDKFKSGIAFLMTTRGVPSLFYGTEIMMKAWSNPDAKVRLDFPGGWPNDSINKFEESGRTETENEAFNYIKKLANYRKNSKVLQVGKLSQFAPEKGIYVYFRYDEKQTVMVVMNSNKSSETIDLERFKERIQNYPQAKNIVTNEVLKNLKTVTITPNQTLILELGKFSN